ncbi:hypothetical protein BGZ72_005850 [Mortierella alpina]|nr:hypothetical protein BGZ72_005850 [Mortierella alpina]
MELHSLLGQHPGSPAIEDLLAKAAREIDKGQGSSVQPPTIKVYSDAAYYSYLPLGISLNYRPSKALVPSPLGAKNNDPAPDSSLLTLEAIHLYRSPADKFETFPLRFRLFKEGDSNSSGTAYELDMHMKAHEIVQLLGEPEEKQSGGRGGNCWIGYQKSLGFALDFAGSNWDDRDMDRVQLNGDGEPMDLTQDGSSSNFKSGVVSEPAIVVLEKRIRQLIDSNRVMVFSKTYCPYSAAAKTLLRSYTNDFKVLEVDLEDQDADIKRLLTKITRGHSTFPSIFFQGESIGGKDNLQALEDRNELKSRLESVGVAMLQ